MQMLRFLFFRSLAIWIRAQTDTVRLSIHHYVAFVIMGMFNTVSGAKHRSALGNPYLETE